MIFPNTSNNDAVYYTLIACVVFCVVIVFGLILCDKFYKKSDEKILFDMFLYNDKTNIISYALLREVFTINKSQLVKSISDNNKKYVDILHCDIILDEWLNVFIKNGPFMFSDDWNKYTDTKKGVLRNLMNVINVYRFILEGKL